MLYISPFKTLVDVYIGTTLTVEQPVQCCSEWSASSLITPEKILQFFCSFPSAVDLKLFIARTFHQFLPKNSTDNFKLDTAHSMNLSWSSTSPSSCLSIKLPSPEAFLTCLWTTLTSPLFKIEPMLHRNLLPPLWISSFRIHSPKPFVQYGFRQSFCFLLSVWICFSMDHYETLECILSRSFAQFSPWLQLQMRTELPQYPNQNRFRQLQHLQLPYVSILAQLYFCVMEGWSTCQFLFGHFYNSVYYSDCFQLSIKTFYS